MKHLPAPAFAALLVGLGAVSATPAHAVAVVSSQDFNWGTELAPPVNGITPTNGGIPMTVSGQFTIQNLDAFRSTILGGATQYPIVNPTLIVDGMDTGSAFPNPAPYIELEQSQVGGTIWDIWSIHFHNPWDWTWIRFGAFPSTEAAVNALLTPGSLFDGTAMLMPADGSPTQNFVVGVQTVPEPLTMLGAGTALGFGTAFKRELAKKQKKAGKKSE